ncbi:MAG: hypothetical protein RLZZ532_1511, partial [Cyanobacteriota bacterium]
MIPPNPIGKGGIKIRTYFFSQLIDQLNFYGNWV